MYSRLRNFFKRAAFPLFRSPEEGGERERRGRCVRIRGRRDEYTQAKRERERESARRVSKEREGEWE